MAKARLAAKRLKLDQDQQEKKLDGAIAQLAATNGPRSPRATNKNEGKASGAASGRCFPGGGLRTLYKYTNLSLLSTEPPGAGVPGTARASTTLRSRRRRSAEAVPRGRQRARGRTRREAPSRRRGAFARAPHAVDAARPHVVETAFGGRAAEHQRLRLLHLCHGDAGRRGRGEAAVLDGSVDVLARAPAAEVFLEGMNAGALLI